MNTILTITAIYLAIGIIFSFFIFWANKTVVKDDKQVDLEDQAKHVLILLWPMFFVVFVVSFVIATVKRFIKGF
tara:strand:- start:551 stop:772 length:222 start_codon:yes stop_codon:yes gene_type:complete